MIQPLLSILIPSTISRRKDLSELINCINEQYYTRMINVFDVGAICASRYFDSLSEIEILVFEDAKIMTVGEKRELLYKHAKGKYSWQIDDDDDIEDGAIELILKAIKSNPEVPCITFREKCIINREYKSSNHSIKYDKWQDRFDGYDYVRTPFYKDVIRTDIAKSVPFPHIRYNEDEQWSMAIKPLLTSEIHIDKELYHYIYEPKETHEERYGLDRN
jgi:hypothetical protein